MRVTNTNFSLGEREIATLHPSQLRLLLILVAGIFLAEVVAMIAIFYLRPEPYWVETLVDASIMIILIIPILYLFHFRPLAIQTAERNRSEGLLQSVLENLPVGVWIVDAKGAILHGNRASQKIWAGARYVGMDQYGEYKAWRLDSGKPVEPEQWAASRCLASGNAILEEELEIECFDGSRKMILNSATPILENGTIQGAIVVNQDITERKQAEQALAKSETLFKTAFNILPVGAWITDETGKIIFGNPAGYQIWAGARYVGIEQFEEYKAWWLSTGQRIQPEDWAVARAVRSGETSLNEEIEIECFDGSHKFILNSAIPVCDDQGKTYGVFVVNQDITAHKHAEQLLERQNQELQALSLAESKQRQLAETLNAASLELSQTLNFETVMNTLLEYVCRLVPADRAYIVLSEDETSMTLLAMHGYDHEASPLRTLNFTFQIENKPYLSQVIETRKSLLIPDTKQYPGWKTLISREDIRSWLGIPFVIGTEAIGVVALAKTNADFFTSEHTWLAEVIIAQASVAIQNAWLFEQVRAGHERLQSLSRRLVDVQESERRYIARELHDEASQSLTALMFGLQLLEQEVHQPEAALARLAELKRLTDGVLEELHRLAMGLRPASLDYLGLVEALEQLVKSMTGRQGLSIHFKVIDFPEELRLPNHIETNIYRIVQEALTNTVRHAQAKNVDIILEHQDGKIVIMIEDNGIGFDASHAPKSGHLGLLGMQERAQMIAGTLHVESDTGCGTTIVLEVPYDASNPDRG